MKYVVAIHNLGGQLLWSGFVTEEQLRLTDDVNRPQQLDLDLTAEQAREISEAVGR